MGRLVVLLAPCFRVETAFGGLRVVFNFLRPRCVVFRGLLIPDQPFEHASRDLANVVSDMASFPFPVAIHQLTFSRSISIYY